MTGPDEPTARRLFSMAARVFLVGYFAVIVLAVVTTWTYQTEWGHVRRSPRA